MIYMLLAVAFVLCGMAVGNVVWHRPGFLRAVSGPIPHYAVHREAELVAMRLAANTTTTADKKVIDRAARRIRVWTSATAFNPGAPGSRYGRVAAAFTSDGGRRVYVQGGEGWEERLARVMAHAIRGIARGDEDPEQHDRWWFDAAMGPWLVPTQKAAA